jgi:hypothetical protein
LQIVFVLRPSSFALRVRRMNMKKKRTKSRSRRRRLTSCEHRSDVRTAEFIVRRIDEIQDETADLLPDIRTFDHYSEMEDVGWVLRMLQRIKRKYERFATNGAWEDS